MSEDYDFVVKEYSLEPLEDYNSYVTYGKEGVEVHGVMLDESLLVYDSEEGWYSIPEDRWTKIIWDECLNGYSADTKLMFMQTIPHLSTYSRPVEVIPNTPLLLFEWGYNICYPNHYMALAHTVLEARYIISKELGYYPEKLNMQPVIHKKPITFISVGDE